MPEETPVLSDDIFALVADFSPATDAAAIAEAFPAHNTLHAFLSRTDLTASDLTRFKRISDTSLLLLQNAGTLHAQIKIILDHALNVGYSPSDMRDAISVIIETIDDLEITTTLLLQTLTEKADIDKAIRDINWNALTPLNAILVNALASRLDTEQISELLTTVEEFAATESDWGRYFAKEILCRSLIPWLKNDDQITRVLAVVKAGLSDKYEDRKLSLVKYEDRKLALANLKMLVPLLSDDKIPWILSSVEELLTVSDTSWEVYHFALEILQELIPRLLDDQIPWVLMVSKKCLSVKSYYTRRNVRMYFGVLMMRLSKEQISELLMTVEEKWTTDPYFSEDTLEILEILISSLCDDQIPGGRSRILEVTKKRLWIHENSYFYEYEIEHLMILILRLSDDQIPEVLTVVKERLNHHNFIIRDDALKMLGFLIPRLSDKQISEVWAIIKSLMEDPVIRGSALMTLKILIPWLKRNDQITWVLTKVKQYLMNNFSSPVAALDFLATLIPTMDLETVRPFFKIVCELYSSNPQELNALKTLLRLLAYFPEFLNDIENNDQNPLLDLLKKTLPCLIPHLPNMITLSFKVDRLVKQINEQLALLARGQQQNKNALENLFKQLACAICKKRERSDASTPGFFNPIPAGETLINYFGKPEAAATRGVFADIIGYQGDDATKDPEGFVSCLCGYLQKVVADYQQIETVDLKF